jgi:tight adherence protein B
MPPVVGALFGLCCAVFALLAVDGLRRRPRASLAARIRATSRATRLRIAGGLLVGLLVEVMLGWPVAALVVAVAVVLVPPLLTGRVAARRQEARLEGVAAWAEMLRDNLRSASGLQQAIVASADAPPDAIAAEVRHLAAELARRVSLTQALPGFARALADPVAHVIVGQLVLAASAQAGQLSKALSEVAAQAREQVAMRLDVEADRAGIRTQIRMIIITTVALVAGLVLFRHAFLRPYQTLSGQMVIAVIGMTWAAGFALLSRLSRFTELPLLFADPPPQAGPR